MQVGDLVRVMVYGDGHYLPSRIGILLETPDYIGVLPVMILWLDGTKRTIDSNRLEVI